VPQLIHFFIPYYLYLDLINKDMAVRIVITKGDITSLGCDAIVNPANSQGLMGGGVALAIKKAGGDIIEQQAVAKAPIDVGYAISTTAGNLHAGFVIHAPTMEQPTQEIPIENVIKATYAALDLGNRLGAKSIAIPGMGTGIGWVGKPAAAEAIVRTIDRFLKERLGPHSTLEKIILVAYDNELFEEFKKWTKQLNPGAK
jgi:O-acetyl-ADP-ribose deacetylase (regulator of RNase III)